MSKTIVLTGITTTGTPHLGNYVGAIRPAIESSQDHNVLPFYFLADYHALIKCLEPERVAQSTLEIAATWLALGLDTENAVFYRQSDVPEIAELSCGSPSHKRKRCAGRRSCLRGTTADGSRSTRHSGRPKAGPLPRMCPRSADGSSRG